MSRAPVLRFVMLATASSVWVAGLKSDGVARENLPQNNDKCMMCLCEAVGKNQTCVSDMRQTCVHQNTHGPFCISEPFWIDAGKPVLPGDDKDLPGAFLRCVEEPFCAVQTVRGYMETGPGLQDCDKNGYFDCKDLILTHLHGRYNCKNEPDKRVTHLEKCMGEALLRPTTAPPRQAASASGRGLPSSRGNGGRYGIPDVNEPPHGVGIPDNWPAYTYGRGADGAGFGNMNALGEFGHPRSLPRDSFNSLVSRSMSPGSRAVPEDVITNSRNQMGALGQSMKEFQDKLDSAISRASESARNAYIRQNPNPDIYNPSTDSDGDDSPSD